MVLIVAFASRFGVGGYIVGVQCLQLPPRRANDSIRYPYIHLDTCKHRGPNSSVYLNGQELTL